LNHKEAVRRALRGTHRQSAYLLLGGTADFTDHHDALRLRVRVKVLEAVDEEINEKY